MGEKLCSQGYSGLAGFSQNSYKKIINYGELTATLHIQPI